MTDRDLPVVLLHGFLGDAADFAAVAAALEPHWHCVRFDLPGHGPAPRPAAAGGFDAGTAQVRAEIAARGITRCHLVGYSMGGRLALRLATLEPELVGSVTAIGAGTGIVDPAERDRRRAADEELAARLEREPLGDFLHDWYRQELFGPLRESAGFAAVLARRQRGDAAALARALRTFGVGGQEPLLPALARCPRPILLIAGALDPRYVAHHAHAAATCPAVESRVLPAAGHSAHLEQPHELAGMIADFLSRQQE